MITRPPPRPSEGPHKRDLVEMRIVNLRRELEANADPWARAAVLYEIGSLYEHQLERVPEALQYYAEAQLVVPEFQPASLARLRISERGGRSEEAGALLLNQVTSAGSPAIRAAASLDLALDSGEWADLLRQAMARGPAPAVPALLLEWLGEARDDREALRDALRTQAAHAAAPSLQAALWIDVAIDELDRGDVDEALDALERACEDEQLAWVGRSLQRRIAREHKRAAAFVEASTAMAQLLEDAQDSEAAIDPLVLPVPAEERLPTAAFLWEEAACSSAMELDDAERASRLLDRALALCPNDLGARLQAIRFSAQSGNQADLERARSWYRDLAPDDSAFATQSIRAALASKTRPGAIDALRGLATEHPTSSYAQAALEVALIANDARSERVAKMTQSAEGVEGDARGRLLWHAAQLSSSIAGEAAASQRLFSEAARESSSQRSSILREALGAALRARNAEAILVRCGDLLDCEIEAAERAWLEHCRYEVTRHLPGSDEDAKRLLRAALHEEHNGDWAPHVARARAALDADVDLLAEAHRALAARTTGSLRAGHLCAEGQAQARRHDWDAAERAFREAMEIAPDDAFPVAALETMLHEAGRAEAVVALAKERSRKKSGRALGELSLLLAGATAERNGDHVAARHAYEEALAQAPDSPSAVLALADVARRDDDGDTIADLYASLSKMELGGGVPALFSLLRGDLLAGRSAGSVAATEAYDRALDEPVSALHASAALLSTPLQQTSHEQRMAAEEIFFEAGMPLTDPTDDAAAAFGPLRFALGRQDATTGEAWLRLGTAAPNESIATATLLHGLRATRIARGEESADELFMLAQEAEPWAATHPEAAIAIDEALAPGDDPEIRAAAFAHKLNHSSSLGRSALEAAYCRALVEAGRAVEAVAMLTGALDERPDDLALWETLRTAARRAQEWPLVAQACERLAQFVDGSLEADLLEEAGVVRLDCLQQFQQAEGLFRRALEADPLRQVAFRRLRDLLAAREDAEALDELVTARLELGGPKDRPALLYDRARLLRGFSDRPGALEVLGELFAEQPNHAGALALAAEVHVSLEQWDEAIECLRKLSRADIPDDQRCVAHLGAADFLESHLGSKDEALLELRAVDRLGLADPHTLSRIGRLEEELGDGEAASEAYARALDGEPTNAEAIAGLVRLADDADAGAAIERYEHAIWARIDAGELDEGLLEGLRNAALWRGARDRAAVIAAVQRALSAETSGEAQDDRLELDAPRDSLRDDEGGDSILRAVVALAEPAVARSRERTKHARQDIPTPEAGAPFEAGQLAWATPRGAGWIIDESPESIAGTLAAILRAARCRVALGSPPLPAAEVKLRRSVRKQIHDAVGAETFTAEALLEFARAMQRTADRAGLIASSDVAAGFSAILNRNVTLASLRASPRALDLLRFSIDADSPLWRQDA